MIRWVLLAALMASIPATDMVVDWQFQQVEHGYPIAEVEAVNRLAGVSFKVGHDCGEDWLCLVEWAEEQRKGKRK